MERSKIDKFAIIFRTFLEHSSYFIIYDWRTFTCVCLYQAYPLETYPYNFKNFKYALKKQTI